MKIISRKEAAALGMTRYFTGRPCKRGHIAKRDVVNCTCVECTLDWKRKNPERVKQYSHEYYHENRETIIEKKKEYFASVAGKATEKRSREKNKDKRNAYNRAWSVNNPEKKAQIWENWYERKGAEYYRLRYQTNILVKLANQLRCRLNLATRHIRNDKLIKAGSAVRDLGCSLDLFREHLESQFSSSMTWENFGVEWEIDHIKPLGLFDLTDRQQFLEACHYTNLQPLSVVDHRRKTVSDRRIIFAARQTADAVRSLH